MDRLTATVSPEKRDEMVRQIREAMKGVVGVKDTADLDPQAQIMWDWFTGKIVK